MADNDKINEGLKGKLEAAWENNAPLRVIVSLIAGLPADQANLVTTKIKEIDGATNMTAKFAESRDTFGVCVTLPAQKIKELSEDSSVASIRLFPPRL